jgi:hypothetical protein
MLQHIVVCNVIGRGLNKAWPLYVYFEDRIWFSSAFRLKLEVRKGNFLGILTFKIL